MHEWRATILGPPASPYDGGSFVVEFAFPTQYPFKAPIIRFLTKIYHPGVKKDTGEICADLLQANWGPTLNVRHCIETLYGLMLSPDADHPLETDIASQFREKPKEFEKEAKRQTKEYATGS